MLTYKYIARDPANGKKVEGEIQAENEQGVTKYVKEQGYALIEVNLKKQSGIRFII